MRGKSASNAAGGAPEPRQAALHAAPWLHPAGTALRTGHRRGADGAGHAGMAATAGCRSRTRCRQPDPLRPCAGAPYRPLASGEAVTLCLTADMTHCDLAGREWMLFRNQEGGSLAQREAGETVLRRWPLPRGVQVGGTRGYAWYLPQPRAAATLTLDFCHPAAPAARRSVIVSQTGRPRVTSPGLPSSPAGSPRTCP